VTADGVLTRPDVEVIKRSAGRRLLWLAVLVVVLLVIVVASVIFGVRAVSLDDALAALSGGTATAEQAAAAGRLPRTVLGLLAGMSLAIAGGAMQAVPRNPLADPGIFGVLSIADNVSVASLDHYLTGGIFLNHRKIAQLVRDNVKKLSIKTPSIQTHIASLSGGNQQKVLISRWLANNPDVLILDEPTRGIDVGAKYEIYCIIAELARQGKSIIMISSELPELLGMSDRIMVMCDGRVTGIVDGQHATQEKLMELATQFEA